MPTPVFVIDALLPFEITRNREVDVGRQGIVIHRKVRLALSPTFALMVVTFASGRACRDVASEIEPACADDSSASRRERGDRVGEGLQIQLAIGVERDVDGVGNLVAALSCTTAEFSAPVPLPIVSTVPPKALTPAVFANTSLPSLTIVPPL